MAEVYSNLENFNEILSHQQLILENQELKLLVQKLQIHLDESSANLKQLRKEILQDFDNLSADHQQLLINYSSLLKTARAEVERKADLMTNIHSSKDQMFLRFLQDKTNMSKGRLRGKSKNKDVKLPRGKKKSGSADICDLKFKTQDLKDVKGQLKDRKNPDMQLKTKTEYRIPKLTKPKDELVLAKKDTKTEVKEPCNVIDGIHEKENKEIKVKAASIFSRRKSMPVFRHETGKFNSDEECPSTKNAKSSLTKDETDTSLGRYKRINDKRTEGPTKKPSEPTSSEHQHYDSKESSIAKRHSDDRETSNDLRNKLYKNRNTREVQRSKDNCPSREESRYKYKEYRDRSWERHEEQHYYKDKHRRRAPDVDHRPSRRDAHERGRQRVLESPPPKSSRRRVLESPPSKNTRQRVLESPPGDKYARNKSRDRKSNYHQAERKQVEQESDRQRPHQDQHVKQKLCDETSIDHSSNRQTDKKPVQDLEKEVRGPAKHKIGSEDEEPGKKRRKLDTKPSEGNHGKERQKAVELEDLPRHNCQSPDELIMENINVDTPIKEISNADATGHEDPRLTSKKYLKIVEDNNIIRLSTVIGRNVDLDVLAPYSSHIFESKDRNRKFEEYTEEDLVKNMYMNFDDDTNCSGSLESGEIDDGDVYSDLLIDDVPEKAVSTLKEQSTSVPPPLSSNTSQVSECGSIPVKDTQLCDPDVLSDIVTRKLEESEDNACNLEEVTKKNQILESKSRHNLSPAEKIPSSAAPTLTETVPLNLTTSQKSPLEFLLSQLNQKCDVQSNINIDIIETDVATKHDISTSMKIVDTETTEGRSSHCSKDKHSKDVRDAENNGNTDDAAEITVGEAHKAVNKRQMVAGDLELSDDENSDNIDLHNMLVKDRKEFIEETKPIETKNKKKSSNKSREGVSEGTKTHENSKCKEPQKSSKFIELFGESSSLITPEDLDLITLPQTELQADFLPPPEEDVTVHVDTSDKATLTDISGRPAKTRTRSSKAKKDNLDSKNPIKHEKSKRHSEAAEKCKDQKKRNKKDEKIYSQKSDIIKIISVTPIVESEPNIKTLIISTGMQPVILERKILGEEGPQSAFQDITDVNNAQTGSQVCPNNDDASLSTKNITEITKSEDTSITVLRMPVPETNVADNASITRSELVVPETVATCNAQISDSKMVISESTKDHDLLSETQAVIPEKDKEDEAVIDNPKPLSPDTSNVNTPKAVVEPTNLRAFAQFSHVPSALATSTPSRNVSDVCKIPPRLPESCADVTGQDIDCSASMHSANASTSMQSMTLNNFEQSHEGGAPDVRIILKRRRRRVLK